MDKDLSPNSNGNQVLDPSSVEGYVQLSFQQYSTPPNYHSYSTSSQGFQPYSNSPPFSHSHQIANPRGFSNPQQLFGNSQQFPNSQPHQFLNMQQFPNMQQYYHSQHNSNAQQFSSQGFQPPYGFPSPNMPAKGFDTKDLSGEPDVADDGENDIQLKRAKYSTVESELLAKCWVDQALILLLGMNKNKNNIGIESLLFITKIARKIPQEGAKNVEVSFWKTTKGYQVVFRMLCSMWPSGHSDADIIRCAHEEFRKLSKDKPFKHSKVWDILKECPKFAHVAGYSQSSYQTDSPNPASDASEQVEARPEGQKAAKRKAIEKGKGTLSQSATYHELVENFNNASKNILEISKATQYREEYDICLWKTSKMDVEQLEMHNKVCNQTKKKWGWT